MQRATHSWTHACYTSHYMWQSSTMTRSRSIGSHPTWKATMLQPLPTMPSSMSVLHYASWDNFQRTFTKTFCLENESTHAFMHLNPLHNDFEEDMMRMNSGTTHLQATILCQFRDIGRNMARCDEDAFWAWFPSPVVINLECRSLSTSPKPLAKWLVTHHSFHFQWVIFRQSQYWHSQCQAFEDVTNADSHLHAPEGEGSQQKDSSVLRLYSPCHYDTPSSQTQRWKWQCSIIIRAYSRHTNGFQATWQSNHHLCNMPNYIRLT